MGCEYVIYIDEAGDDGLGKLRNANGSGQSRWFAVGACCVRYSNDQNLVKWRDEIANNFANRQSRDIHFKHLKHDQRRYACRILGRKPVRIAAAISNKVTLLDLPPDRLQTYKRKNHLHNYLTRWLLERISAALKQDSIKYGLTNSSNSPGKIDWDVIDPDNIQAMDHDKRAGLQLADIATSAIFKAVEPNRFEVCESSYANELRNVIFKHPVNKSALDYGIIHIPRIKQNTPLNAEQKAFFNSWK